MPGRAAQAAADCPSKIQGLVIKIFYAESYSYKNMAIN
jgi:hypothetical protein